MSRTLATLLASVFVLTAATPVAANDPEPPKTPVAGEAVPGEVVVKFRDEARGPDLARSRGLALVTELGVPGKGLPAVLSTGGRSVEAVVAELNADPAVDYAEPNYVVSLAVDGGVAVAVDDPKSSDQYSLDQMRVRSAWARSTGASNVIAVLDTGVQASHPDLKGRVLKGYDFVNTDTSAADDNGHGTWVAGIIAANANDGYGIAGISWSDKILPVKIMNANGTGSTSDLTSGIVWAANQGADVINMSVGGFPYSQAVLDAVNYAWSKGVVLVGAAGNNARREDFYPASYDRVISVSATQVNDEFSHWSSYGPKVDVSAPGSSVLTTNCTAAACPNRGWGSHTHISGTSFATPNVAGVVALIMARYPHYTPSQVMSRLLGTVDDRGYTGRDDRYGVGRVNAHRALGATSPHPGTLAGDAMEGNNGLSSATPIPLNTSTSPTIYPAGDVDWFSVNVPRAGRLDVRVTGVVDSRAYPWNRSSLPMDPIVELYLPDGSLLKRVDNEWESGTELAQHAVAAKARILIRVQNYYPNGSRVAYSVTPTFVDTVPPIVTKAIPGGGVDEVSQWITATARFSERVYNVSSSTVRIRDMATNAILPATVTYSATRSEALITPVTPLVGDRQYRFELGSGIRDGGGNALTATRMTFNTSDYSFSDIQGTPFADEIEWLVDRGITRGCTSDRFCPQRMLNRGEMASFLARALDLPAALEDHFTDDDGLTHEDAINRIADAGITLGCGGTRFCARATVTRGQMASFLARAFSLPATKTDFFRDDDALSHEDNINRLAASGITSGCGGTSFCPNGEVNRQQTAAFVHRALTR